MGRSARKVLFLFANSTIMRTVILAILLLYSTGLFAQETKIGVSIDPQYTWMSVESKKDDQNGGLLGVSGGLLIDHYFQKNYAFQTGIALGIQGGGIKYGDSLTLKVYDETTHFAPGTTIDYKLQYINVPLGLKLKTNEIGYFSYFARIGFTNQLNIGAKASSSDNQLDNDVIKKEINIYNLSYHFGIGAQYALTKDTSIILGVTYHNGFINVTKNSDSRVFSRIVSVRLGVIF